MHMSKALEYIIESLVDCFDQTTNEWIPGTEDFVAASMDELTNHFNEPIDDSDENDELSDNLEPPEELKWAIDHVVEKA